MGKLYDMCQKAMTTIDERGMDTFRTRGAFAIETGFLISMVQPDDPDDPEKIARVQAAAEKILGQRL